jgi:transposase InsO family protein
MSPRSQPPAFEDGIDVLVEFRVAARDKPPPRCSASRSEATCFDNSVAEAFWSSLKRELMHRFRFATRAEARAAITAWIHRYNAVRLHSSLNYVPPIEWELNYRRQQLHAA